MSDRPLIPRRYVDIAKTEPIYWVRYNDRYGVPAYFMPHDLTQHTKAGIYIVCYTHVLEMGWYNDSIGKLITTAAGLLSYSWGEVLKPTHSHYANHCTSPDQTRQTVAVELFGITALQDESKIELMKWG